jgi:hypothetical protein
MKIQEEAVVYMVWAILMSREEGIHKVKLAEEYINLFMAYLRTYTISDGKPGI